MRPIISSLAVAITVMSCTSARVGGDEAATASSTRSYSEIIEQSNAQDWIQLNPDYTLYLELPSGTAVIALSRSLATDHVNQIRTLARSRYFDGLRFYRVIEGFVAQFGARGDDRELPAGAADSLVAEFDQPISATVPFASLGNRDGYADDVGFVDGLPAGKDNRDNRIWLAHCTGALAYARSTRPNSAAATLYLTLQPQRYLDRNLSVVGHVVWGMEHVQAITRAFPDEGGIIAEKGRQTPIVSLRVASDIPREDRINLEIFDTNSKSFPELVESRRNRPEAFFIHRPNYIDLCQMPVPVRISN